MKYNNRERKMKNIVEDMIEKVKIDYEKKMPQIEIEEPMEFDFKIQQTN